MTRSIFDPEFSQLPGSLPIFPLSGVLLLPGGRLPLNIFEPRYLSMVRFALQEHRLIGMVQPRVEDAEGALLPGEESEDEDAPDLGDAPIYQTGCAGRITAFSETDDGRYLITLKGLIRFKVTHELHGRDGFRMVGADFNPFASDFKEQTTVFDRPRLLDALQSYFEFEGIEADWDAIGEASDERLITSLAMVCPFSPAEKQALLEAPTPSERAEAMTAIMEMAVMSNLPAGAVSARH